MKKNFKVLSALVLAVVLVATLIAPVAATNTTGSFMMLLLKKNFYYYDGETLVARVAVERGEVNEALALEEKDGMVLEGWYTDAELTEKFDFTQPVECGTILYAKWVEAAEVVAPVEPEVVEPEVEVEVTETPDATEEETEVTEEATEE